MRPAERASIFLVAGLIERNLPGLRKSGRQATFFSDMLYDTLARYGRDHSFAGRNANQMLGLILSKRMGSAGPAPVGFLVIDCALMRRRGGPDARRGARPRRSCRCSS